MSECKPRNEQYRALQLTLLLRPELGAVIRGRGGIRKLRWSLPAQANAAASVWSTSGTSRARPFTCSIHSGLILIEGIVWSQKSLGLDYGRARAPPPKAIHLRIRPPGPASPWCRILDDGKNRRIFAGLANKACHGVANFVDTSSGSMGKCSSRCSRPRRCCWFMP